MTNRSKKLGVASEATATSAYLMANMTTASPFSSFSLSLSLRLLPFPLLPLQISAAAATAIGDICHPSALFCYNIYPRRQFDISLGSQPKV